MPSTPDNPLLRLASLIRYPELPAPDARDFLFLVDRQKTNATLLKDGRLLLRHDLCYLHELPVNHQAFLAQLLDMAFGRSLKEDTILAYDPPLDAIYLWHIEEPPLSDTQFISDFEHFLASYEWWTNRIQELLDPPPKFPSIFFHP